MTAAAFWSLSFVFS